MHSKLLCCVLIILSICGSYCDEAVTRYIPPHYTLASALPASKCGVPFCSTPCVGAAPPPRCPANLPDCSSGCACYPDCDRVAIICFMTRHCLKRRFLTRILPGEPRMD